MSKVDHCFLTLLLQLLLLPGGSGFA